MNSNKTDIEQAAQAVEKSAEGARLEQLLAAEGITIARRTIAKYRDQLRILPASLRRR